MQMLMLMQVNAFHNSQYQTQIKQSAVQPKQIEYDDNLLGKILVFVVYTFRGQTMAEYL